jgi:hypothetical protein
VTEYRSCPIKSATLAFALGIALTHSKYNYAAAGGNTIALPLLRKGELKSFLGVGIFLVIFFHTA